MTSRVAVVGGGLAGMAAAAALCRRGMNVELYEARSRLGGRAASFVDTESGRFVDNCQHVGMGCCTNLIDFLRLTGLADCFERDGRLHFFGPDRRRRDFAAVGWLPAPLHLLLGLMRLGYLGLAERLSIIPALGRLVRLDAGGPAADERTVGRWLRASGQSEAAIERFWAVVLVSALGETLDRASLAAARKVFVDGFMSSTRAYELLLPRLPLAEIFDHRLGEWLEGQGARVNRGTRVKRIDGDGRRVRGLLLADGTRPDFDHLIVAVPWWQVGSVLAPAVLDALPELAGVGRIEPSPITAVHLWFDRPITPLPHAVLVGRLGQWLFNHEPECRCQVVISASGELADRDREDVLGQVVGELEELWPAARQAELLRRRVVTEPAAVFSMRPGVQRLRPRQRTSIGNLALAGDWTSTGWPATMEGAVRSGQLAAEAILAGR